LYGNVVQMVPAVIEMVDVVVVEVHRPLDQAKSESVAAEIEIVLRVVHRGGDVVKAEDHLTPTTIESGPTRCST
jgi:hypothetical protein